MQEWRKWTMARGRTKINRNAGQAVGEKYSKKLLQIAEKSTKLFIKKGYAQSSMREISKVTGVILGNLYNFIERKEDILGVVFDLFHNPEEDWYKRYDIQNIEDPVVALRMAVGKALEIACKNQQAIVLMYREFKALPKQWTKRVLQRESNFVRFFEEILKKGMDRNVFDVDDPFLAANMIVYQISMFPMRNWNLRKYSDKEALKLIEDYILKPILK
jgi:AcrR family transcriptional regulator